MVLSSRSCRWKATGRSRWTAKARTSPTGSRSADATVKAMASGKAYLLGRNIELPFVLEKRLGASCSFDIRFDKNENAVGTDAGVPGSSESTWSAAPQRARKLRPRPAGRPPAELPHHQEGSRRRWWAPRGSAQPRARGGRRGTGHQRGRRHPEGPLRLHPEAARRVSAAQRPCWPRGRGGDELPGPGHRGERAGRPPARAGLPIVGMPRRDLGGPWWEPLNGVVHDTGEPLAAVVHLAGENVAGALDAGAQGPGPGQPGEGDSHPGGLAGWPGQRPSVLVAASATGLYGDRGTRCSTSRHPGVTAFLPTWWRPGKARSIGPAPWGSGWSSCASGSS